MTARTALFGQLIIFVITVAVSSYYATILPEVVPIHWNIHGQVDGYGSRWTNFVLMPTVVLMILGLSFALPVISPKTFEVTRSGKAYWEVMLLVSALMGMVHIIILAGSTNSHLDISKWLFAGIFLFFALVGNLMGKIKRNFFMGIRTPWTLADERVWTETHRIAAHQWFLGGVLGFLLVISGVPMGIMVAFMILMSLWPVYLSYAIYKKVNQDKV